MLDNEIDGSIEFIEAVIALMDQISQWLDATVVPAFIATVRAFAIILPPRWASLPVLQFTGRWHAPQTSPAYTGKKIKFVCKRG